MPRRFSHKVISLCMAFTFIATACRKSDTVQSHQTEDVKWEVTVNSVIEFNDTIIGVGTDYRYTVADTLQINTLLNQVKHCGNTTIGWTIPSSDGSIWLIAYDNEPLIAETVSIITANNITCYGDDWQIAFRFSDAEKWEVITGDNIGKRLAVIVNGQLMNAPKVNTEISSGNCSVIIPGNMVNCFLPNIDIEKQPH